MSWNEKIKTLINKYSKDFIKLFAISSFVYFLFHNINQLLFEIFLCCFVIYLIEYSKKQIEKKKTIKKIVGGKIDIGNSCKE